MTKTAVVNATQTIIADGTGDIVYGIIGTLIVNNAGTVVMQSFSLPPDGSNLDIVAGTSTWRFSVSTLGAFTVIRTAGTGSGTITIMQLGSRLSEITLEKNKFAIIHARYRWDQYHLHNSLTKEVMTMAEQRQNQPHETVFDKWAAGVHDAYATTLKSFAKMATRNEPKAQQTLHRLWAEIFAEATDPRNTLLGNPLARQKARDTYGRSIVDGLLNFWQDFALNDGYPALTDLSAFKVGENLAITPGTVVYRNEMLELIHYTPTTERVHEIPLLIVPPPINKYYILDLAPGRSLVEHAVASGQSVYMISWVNPTESYREVGFVHGYVDNGVLAAMKFIDRPVALAGLCLGGTLASIATAADREDRVRSLSLIVTLTDFGGDVGVMGEMIDQKLVDRVYEHTHRTGTLSAKEMGIGWAWIQALNLVFSPAQRRWLLGEKPPAMDLLAWNADGTRLPSEMHREYLQSCYIDNLFARGKLVVDGVYVGIDDITVPVYSVAGTTDHIVPWKSAFAGISLSSGPRRLALVPRGHIGTIVSIGSKATFAVGPDSYADDWESEAVESRGSWWADWTNWLSGYSGVLVEPVIDEPNLAPAPGLYVLDAAPLSSP